ncbi:ABC transporter substrate-binding protein [Mucilaginibacter ximonensis]|uniref:ABC transporter substrate-binding protein n=1 Tax=Mucilaginibacter ximonensis TaxID=538021 RepID=A0ABW5Y6Q1_9SPHI
MISVRNHLPLLSGNKWFIILGIVLLAACSPKVRPVVTPPKTETEKNETKPQPPKPLPARQSSIALLLPFGLDHLDPGSGYTDVSLKQGLIALDYYQGFQLALDSLTSYGYNYKLRVFDTQASANQSRKMAFNPNIWGSDLIVGPIFPDDMKAFAQPLSGPRKPIVSPLSPAAPATINNPNLVTIIPPLAEHAATAARYICKRLQPAKVFILKSGFTDENDYIIPFKNSLDSVGKGRIKVVQTVVVRGKLGSLIPQLAKGSPNIFVIPSTHQSFITVVMHSLDSLAKSYPVVLFGHPSWEKYSFLHADILQRLRTHITSADKVDYKAAATVNFMTQYRKHYHVEASEYAIKGFDEGMYFGRLLGQDNGDVKAMTKTDYEGIHNNFHIVKRPGTGYVNTHVNVMDYRYYELRKVE